MAFRLAAGSADSRVRLTSGQHGPGEHAVSLVVTLALLPSGEEAAEAPAGTSVEAGATQTYCPAWRILPGEVFRGVHGQQELCLVREGGFALSAFNPWQQELGQERRAVLL